MTDDVGLEALKLLRVKKVAELLDVGERTIWRLIDAERKHPGTGLESVKVGSRVLLPQAAVAGYLKRQRAKGNAA